MSEKKLRPSSGARKSKVMRLFAEDFVSHPYYYHDYNRTLPEVARRLGVSHCALKSFLMGKPIPGLFVELSAHECRGRWLPVYRLYVYDWKRTRSYLKDLVNV